MKQIRCNTCEFCEYFDEQESYFCVHPHESEPKLIDKSKRYQLKIRSPRWCAKKLGENKGEHLTEDMCYNAWLNILMNPLSCAKELDILGSLIKEHFNPQPYKFDELKKGMWGWDDKNEMFILITFINKQFKKMHICLTEYDGFNDEYVNVEYTEYFEEGRFFPITKALEYQK